MSQTQKIYDSNYVSSCYFRSTADEQHKKVLIQITERCNMYCEHCFVSSSFKGKDVSFDNIKEIILPKLLKCNVSKVTLTGGEPLVHPDISKILELLNENNIDVAICTNGLAINDDFVNMCYNLGNIHFNISLDGFKPESHVRFRGIENINIFKKIISNISNVANRGMLGGILVTPNVYASIDEYSNLCDFAKNIGAKYVLFNPLSEFGRGQDTKYIGYHGEDLLRIKDVTQKYIDENFEVVYIRFPDFSKPIGPCPLGKVLYIFIDGSIAICPYLVFAARDRVSRYNPKEFYISNIFDENCNIEYDLANYKLPENDGIGIQCSQSQICSKGCLAAKVSNGLSIYNCDLELCNKH